MPPMIHRLIVEFDLIPLVHVLSHVGHALVNERLRHACKTNEGHEVVEVAKISNHRLSRSEIMAPFTTQEMRENMVFWQHKTALEISKLAQYSERTVYGVLRLHCDYGQANPTLYLDELQEQLFAARDKDVSLATISRAIRKLAMTHKCILKTAAEG
ncbi:hypothetical protein M405DRAFT_846176 [Rhizopogon salebrosus TDB-379]|nr:hypothetical protein M405DRAFT_846176 [Rhizopogon salebrosus TDB-379]